MKTIPIPTAQPYEVIIGSGLLGSLGNRVAALGGSKTAAVVSDSNVWPLYGKAARESLEQAGFTVYSFVFQAGEARKSGETYLNLLNFLAEHRLTRTDWIIALGGGVVGDLAGFAAATFLRGISFVQVPTTLLAAVDSSVGGKTAIDLPAGKNLAGAFYQPRLVLCDLDTLDSLPEEIFREGSAEVIKYSILYDPALYQHLLSQGLDFDRLEVVARCVAWKRDVVSQDEFDRGARQKLNLGHTFGHGVEAQSQFSVSHGSAVAIGMAIAARASEAHGLCSPETRNEILRILERFGLPTCTSYSPEALCGSMLSDKKRTGDTISLILPKAVGDCRIYPMAVEQLLSFLKAGL